MATTRSHSSARAQDRAGSLTRVFAGQRSALLRSATRLLDGDSARAELILQAALDDLLASPPDESEGEDTALCFAACHRHAHAVAQQESRAKRFAELPAAPAQSGAEDYAALLRHIERLTPKQQEVLRLKFQNGFGLPAIAGITDLPRDKVSALLHTAIARLRSEYPAETPVDDGRLTAHALGEASEAERATLASTRDENAEAKTTELRAFAKRIEEALAIEAGARAPRRPAHGSGEKRPWLRRPAFWITLSVAGAAAGVAFFFSRAAGSHPAAPLARSAEDFKLRPSSWRDQPAEAEKSGAFPLADIVTRRRVGESERTARAPATARISPPRTDRSRTPSEGPTTGETAETAPSGPGTPDIAAAIGGAPKPTGAVDTGAAKTPARLTAPSDKSSDANSAAPARPPDSPPDPKDLRAPFAPATAPPPAKLARKGPGARGGGDFRPTRENPVSTLPSDTDTASVAALLKSIGGGESPAPSTVRVEELLNYFPSADPAPPAPATFSATIESAEAPWAPAHRLVRIGLKGREAPPAPRPSANLVFLLDVSASMDSPSRLPLVQEAMRLLLARLRPDDRVAIVTYAGESQLMLPSTPVSESSRIRHVLGALHPAGQTNGGAGIQLAYTIAKASYVEGGANRVILCTDGDFNVGVTDADALSTLAAEQAKAHLTLSVFGFGRGYRIDPRLESLAAHGQGRSGYVNTRREAERALADEIDGLFLPIARDLKLQVVLNPALVSAYRLIGYEHDDQPTPSTDIAPVVGSGHSLTALYEIVPTAVASSNSPVQPLLTFTVDYQEPVGSARHTLAFPLKKSGGDFSSATDEFKFSAAVAAFGLILGDSPHKGTSTLGRVAQWAEAGRGDDPGGYRGDFIDAVRTAEKLMR